MNIFNQHKNYRKYNILKYRHTVNAYFAIFLSNEFFPAYPFVAKTYIPIRTNGTATPKLWNIRRKTNGRDSPSTSIIEFENTTAKIMYATTGITVIHSKVETIREKWAV